VSGITHADVSRVAILQVLLADDELMSIEVTIRGEAKTLTDIFYIIAPQDTVDVYPCGVLNPPITHEMARRKQPNGPPIAALESLQDLWFAGLDVEPTDAGLVAMKARAVEVMQAAPSIDIPGGRLISCVVQNFPPDQRFDKGKGVRSRTGVTFFVTTQLI
jgi:hypothetical protein